MLMANKVVVLAIFKDEAAADAAAQSVKDSGLAEDDAIGVLVLNHKGQVKAEKVGKRSTGKGAGIGLALALFTPVGLAAGLIGGGLLGALHHKGLGLDKADRDRIAAELGDGKAAVGVLAPAAEAVAVMAGLTELGGAAESHEVADEDLEEAHAAARRQLLADHQGWSPPSQHQVRYDPGSLAAGLRQLENRQGETSASRSVELRCAAAWGVRRAPDLRRMTSGREPL